MPLNYTAVIVFLIALVALYILMWVFVKPVKLMLKLVLHAALGCGALWVYNLLAGSIGMSIGINLYTALTCGILGVPGFILLVILRFFFPI